MGPFIYDLIRQQLVFYRLGGPENRLAILDARKMRNNGEQGTIGASALCEY